MQLLQKNASAAFEQLNRFLNDVKVWMPTSKLKLNLDKTEFIIFGFEETEGQFESMFSFHSSQLPPYVVWHYWLCSEMVHFLPNRWLSVNKIGFTL